MLATKLYNCSKLHAIFHLYFCNFSRRRQLYYDNFASQGCRLRINVIKAPYLKGSVKGTSGLRMDYSIGRGSFELCGHSNSLSWMGLMRICRGESKTVVHHLELVEYER